MKVEAIGELGSPDRKDPFLVGVSVTACSREVSNAMGRIGDGGRSKRGGFEFESERFSIAAKPKS